MTTRKTKTSSTSARTGATKATGVKQLPKQKVVFAPPMADMVKPRADYNFASVLQDRQDFKIGTGEAVASALTRGLPMIRRMVRNAVRMNGIASRPADVTAAMVIGQGMSPLCPDEELTALFKKWCMRAGSDGLGDFRYFQELAWREFFNVGEVFVQFRPRTKAKGVELVVPFQVQLIPSEMVPVNVHPRIGGKREVIAGMAYDRYGEVTHYYRFKHHPGDAISAVVPQAQELMRVPASLFLHVMKQNEIGAHRGESSLTRALVRIHDMEKFLGAELLRKVLNANVAYWLEMPDLTPQEKDILSDIVLDPETGRYYNSDNEEVEAPKNYDGFIASKDGSVKILPPGGKMNVTAPAEVGGSFVPFVRAMGLHIAMATNVPYEFLFMDAAGIQDRIYKGFSLQFEKQVEMWRSDFATMCLVPIWNMFVKMAVDSGAWSPPAGTSMEDFLDVPWAGRPFPNLHRSQEVASWGEEIELGIATESDIIRRQGDDPARVRRERLADTVDKIRMGLEPPPAFWTDEEIKERVGWNDERIEAFRSVGAVDVTPQAKTLRAVR